jgi:hypothetical protein
VLAAEPQGLKNYVGDLSGIVTSMSYIPGDMKALSSKLDGMKQSAADVEGLVEVLQRVAAHVDPLNAASKADMQTLALKVDDLLATVAR